MKQAVINAPIEFQDYPIDARIRIYSTSDKYDVEVDALGEARRWTINMSHHDLSALNDELQVYIHSIVSNNKEPVVSMESESTRQLQTLAEKGHFAFKKVFKNSDCRQFIQRLLGRLNIRTLQIVSEDFFLPWELIYPCTPTKPDYLHFWGMKYVISRVIPRDDFPAWAHTPSNISGDSSPKLGLLAYNGLRAVEDKEIPFFKKLEDNGDIVFFKLRPLNPDLDKKKQELKEVEGLWKTPLDLAHFACHAIYERKVPSQSRLLLSDEFPISIQDIEVYNVFKCGKPLVIMNACETGNCDPLYTWNFAEAFLKYGAPAVVVTECELPDAFAADFVEVLYTNLLKGKSVGDSLLATRRFFYKQHHNPSGLLYSLYGKPSIVVKKAQKVK